ncbi:hypothetical protein [Nocardioides litoris]|uniref:hypothetical protein n=1 Tax=Nocardioides litoris TaxID=1926648 RepID=UPI00111CB199|nr:hypothetical protein [Nocardioides litoris]
MPTECRCEELAEDLATCRAELALARRQQEEAAEALAASEVRRRRLRQRGLRLASAAADLLSAPTVGSRVAGRVRRAAGRPDPERDQLDLVRGSDLFDPAFYLLEHPEVVTTSLDPALHFLRHGAELGWDPSPDFDTRRFLREHPGVAESGRNPLVAHLLGETGAEQPDQA